MKTTLHTITRRLLLLSLLLAATLPARAYDFMEDGLCYKVNSGNTTVTVTYQITNTGTNGNTYGAGYENLTGDLVIPENVIHLGKTYQVTSIGDHAFYNCTGLTSVTIPNSVTTIGGADQISSDGASFYNCTGLTSVTIPNSVTLIGKNSFNSCSGLTSVTIGDSVTLIGERAFEKCTSLTSVIIPNSVTTIGGSAFSNCTGLTSVNYGNSITSIKGGAFYNCTSLTSLDLPSSLKYIGDGAFELCTGLTEVTIPDSVTQIGGLAFAYCEGLTSVDLDNSVKDIGWGAFKGCTGLTSVTIPNSVISIGNEAFSGCSGLKSATIGDNVYYINEKAFSQCTSLEEIVIGKSVVDMGLEMCSGCTALKTVKWNAKRCNDFFYNESPFYCMNNIESFIFGEEVEVIPYCLCYGMSGLTSVTIPNSVKDIGFNAFYGCTGLTSVNIGDSVTAIGQSAFGYCTSLPLVGFGKSVRIIEYEAFRGCSSLTTVDLPNSVTNIGGSAFYDCESLTSVTISNSVVRVGSSSFYNCGNLNTVTFGENVSLIGPEAFKGCSSLNKVVALMRQPITISSSVFEGVPRANCDLHVRQGSKTDYENQDVWKDFLITEDAEEYADISPVPGDVNCDETINAVDITALYNYMLNGDQTYVATSDVNGDGHINSVDVSAIYDILLGNMSPELYTGLYMGITGFNQSLMKNGISFVDFDKKQEMRGFIDNLSTNNGSILYYAVEEALNDMAEAQVPADLSNVFLITFTDGLDQGSLAMTDAYNNESQYLAALNHRIKTVPIHGKPVKAYSIGLRSSDVTNYAMFQNNLQLLASDNDNATEVADIAQLKIKLQEIADEIDKMCVDAKQSVTVTMTGVEDGRLIRFVLDGGTAETTNLYIDARFSKQDHCLYDVSYHGLTCEKGSVIEATSVNNLIDSYKFEFNGLRTTSGNGIKLGAIKEYVYHTDGFEFWANPFAYEKFFYEISITRNNTSALVMLVLDCSSSLESDISTLKSAVMAFVNISPASKPAPGTHEYVDLALPSGTLWATTNIGASSPEDPGDYFAWGETDPELKRYYDFITYKWCEGTYYTMTKYCNRPDFGIVDNKLELEPNDDAATVNWGPEWCMPSKDQCQELKDECTWEWTTIHGANGYMVTSKHNGASLFLPSPGIYSWDELYGHNSGGRYWMRNLDAHLPCNSYMMDYLGIDIIIYGSENRCWGRSVRAVRVSNY